MKTETETIDDDPRTLRERRTVLVRTLATPDPRTGDLSWLFGELRGDRPITASDEALEVAAEVERRAILVFLARAAKSFRADDHLSQRYTILELIDDLRAGDHHRRPASGMSR